MTSPSHRITKHKPGRWSRSFFYHAIRTILCLAVLLTATEIYCRYRFPLPDYGNLIRDGLLGWDTPVPMSVVSDTGSGSIYFVGDSFAADARWLASTFDALGRAGIAVQGYNLGVPAYGTTQEYLKVRQYYDLHKPAVVVLLFFAWNDMRDNVKYPTVLYSPFFRNQPFFVKDAKGEWRIDDPRYTPSLADLLNRSAFFIHAGLPILQERTVQALRDNGIDYFTTHHLEDRISNTEPKAWWPFYETGSQQRPYVQAGYDATEHALTELNRFLQERGSTLVVIGIDNAFSVDRDVALAYTETGADLSLPLKRIGDILSSNNITFVNAVPALQAKSRQLRKKIYNGPAGSLSAHFEPEGIDVLAEVTTKAIRNALQTPHH